MKAPLCSGAVVGSSDKPVATGPSDDTATSPQLNLPPLASLYVCRFGPNTKIRRVFNALCEQSLNRFEAEEIGDHCLNSTVAAIEAQGISVSREWEIVSTRWGRAARVRRYWIAQLGRPVSDPSILNFRGGAS